MGLKERLEGVSISQDFLDRKSEIVLDKIIQIGGGVKIANIIEREGLKNKIERGDEFVLLDVRDTPDYKNEHIVGAKHMLITDMKEKAHNLGNKGDEIIVYSEDFNCPASTIASKKLEEMGFSNIKDYKGSFKDWKDAGLPTEK